MPDTNDLCGDTPCNECPVGCTDYEDAMKKAGHPVFEVDPYRDIGPGSGAAYTVPEDWCRRKCPFRVNGACLPDADGRVCPPSLNPAGWGIRSSHGEEKQ